MPRKPVLWFVLLVFVALLLQALGMLLLALDAPLFLYLGNLYGLTPLCAALLPALCGFRGVHPFAAFFPIGLALLFSPAYAADGIALLCMGLSLVGAVAGREAAARR